ncbi:3-oxo-5-alpha-steroid 4-dehydrogenase [Anaeramoeba flamelloides]|uniref:3-oxo-5-alpha-steroid 4-dehydrogenase n=1 Tax=Anaeramoeba flamelloides TaxID=1746091 RepID=A0ABQ8Z0P9_9EUKA|nr:3-oxo-5-alpha-steroid 4-dehydrogenase [Anaeramoeba flamelloides]
MSDKEPLLDPKKKKLNEVSQEIYGSKTPSLAPKLIVLLSIALNIAVTSILFFSEAFRNRFKRFKSNDFHLTALSRRIVLVTYGGVYFLRLSFSTMFFVKRKMKYQESFTIFVWLSIIFNSFCCFAVGNSYNNLLWLQLGLSIAFYLIGSIFNTGSELMRHFWKKKPENKGKLYTRGFNSITRHPNYFGDVLLFSGWAIAAGWWTLYIPLLMFSFFVFFNIGVLENYLSEHYSEEWGDYKKRVKSLIPFVL